MNHHQKTIPRRTFLKLSFAVGLIASIGPVAAAIRTPKQCGYCQVDFSNNKTLTQQGYCRNCGANAFSGNRDLPSLAYKASLKSGNFKVAELPFPASDISQLTTKPCFSLQEIRSEKSRVRKMRTERR